MFKTLTSIAFFTLLGAGVALADCPPVTPGTTAEAIRANEQRVICLQREVESRAQIRRLEQRIQSNENAINRIELQRRFDALPRPMPSPFGQPAPFVPN